MTKRTGEREAGSKGDGATRRRGDNASRAKPSLRPVSPSPSLPVNHPPRVSPSLITLLTDFGSADYFVGAMKGVILSLNPQVRIVDITHEIPPQDIAGAAFTLMAAYRSFPPRTVHVAVVDPGVGSSRRPLLVIAGEHFFVGPDNGIFSYVIDREPKARVVHLTNQNYFRHPVSETFHGRDIFAAVAGALSQGVEPQRLGAETPECVRLSALAPIRLRQGKLHARIIHIDRFGNCITNLTPKDLTPEMIAAGARLTIKGKTIKTFRRFFSDEGDDDAELFGLWGSAGFLEIAATNRSAAKLLLTRNGDAVLVSMQRMKKMRT